MRASVAGALGVPARLPALLGVPARLPALLGVPARLPALVVVPNFRFHVQSGGWLAHAVQSKGKGPERLNVAT